MSTIINREMFTKENLKKIISSHIPISWIKNDKYKKLINKFNKTKANDISNFLDKNNLFSDQFYNFYDVLVPIKAKISFCLNNYNDLYDDFNFFIKNFNKEYKKKINEYRKSVKKDEKRKEKKLENQWMYDVSTGIFSVTEAQNRKLFYDLTWDNYSDRTIFLIKKLKFLTDSFYSYLYIKTEQILHFYWSLFNVKKDNKRLYLWDKFKYFSNNCIFNLNINIINEKNFEELNNIWIFFKHQDKKDKENYDFIYKKEQIEKSINFVKNIYSSLEDIKKINNLINKIIWLYNEYDGVVNPLGLTGFEND